MVEMKSTLNDYLNAVEKASSIFIDVLENSKEPDSRAKAALILGEMRSHNAIKYLIKHLDDTDNDYDGMTEMVGVDYYVVKALKKISPVVIEFLTPALESKNPMVRKHAIDIIADVGINEKDVEIIKPLLKDENSEVREFASDSIKKLENKIKNLKEKG